MQLLGGGSGAAQTEGRRTASRTTATVSNRTAAVPAMALATVSAVRSRGHARPGSSCRGRDFGPQLLRLALLRGGSHSIRPGGAGRLRLRAFRTLVSQPARPHCARTLADRRPGSCPNEFAPPPDCPAAQRTQSASQGATSRCIVHGCRTTTTTAAARTSSTAPVTRPIQQNPGSGDGGSSGVAPLWIVCGVLSAVIVIGCALLLAKRRSLQMGNYRMGQPPPAAAAAPPPCGPAARRELYRLEAATGPTGTVAETRFDSASEPRRVVRLVPPPDEADDGYLQVGGAEAPPLWTPGDPPPRSVPLSPILTRSPARHLPGGGGRQGGSGAPASRRGRLDVPRVRGRRGRVLASILQTYSSAASAS